jgi:hypothetical protein
MSETKGEKIMKEREFILYKTKVISQGKGIFPKTLTEYLVTGISDPYYSYKIEDAYKYYDLTEAQRDAYLLNMNVGELKLVVLPLGGEEG